MLTHVAHLGLPVLLLYFDHKHSNIMMGWGVYFWVCVCGIYSSVLILLSSVLPFPPLAFSTIFLPSPLQPGASSNRPLLRWLDFSLVNSPRLSMTSSGSLLTDYTFFCVCAVVINSQKNLGWHSLGKYLYLKNCLSGKGYDFELFTIHSNVYLIFWTCTTGGFQKIALESHQRL